MMKTNGSTRLGMDWLGQDFDGRTCFSTRIQPVSRLRLLEYMQKAVSTTAHVLSCGEKDPDILDIALFHKAALLYKTLKKIFLKSVKQISR
jgi:hypothetical protein